VLAFRKETEAEKEADNGPSVSNATLARMFLIASRQKKNTLRSELFQTPVFYPAHEAQSSMNPRNDFPSRTNQLFCFRRAHFAKWKLWLASSRKLRAVGWQELDMYDVGVFGHPS